MTVRRMAAAWLSLGANLVAIGILRAMGPRALRWPWFQQLLDQTQARLLPPRPPPPPPPPPPAP